MSGKVSIPKVKTSSSATPPVQKKFGGSRPFIDQAELQTEESDTEILQRSPLTPPPPNNGGNNFISSGYKFSQVAITQDTPAIQPKFRKTIQLKPALQPNSKNIPTIIHRKTAKGVFTAPVHVVQTIKTRQRKNNDIPVSLKPLSKTIQRSYEEDPAFLMAVKKSDFSAVIKQSQSQEQKKEKELNVDTTTKSNESPSNELQDTPKTPTEEIPQPQNSQVESVAEKAQEQTKKKSSSFATLILKFILSPLKQVLKLIPDPELKQMSTEIIDTIIYDGPQILTNFISGIRGGLTSFISNIKNHLLNGITSWLFGNIPGGIKLPNTFDIQGFFSILGQLLGINKEYIFQLAQQALGPDIIDILKIIFKKIIGKDINDFNFNNKEESNNEETGNELIQKSDENIPKNKSSFEDLLMKELMGEGKVMGELLMKMNTEGPLALAKFMAQDINKIKERFMEDITSMVNIELIQAGAQKLMGLLGPASGLVKIVQSMVNLITWVNNNLDKIKPILQVITDVIKGIATLTPDKIAIMIETYLAQSIPVVIGVFSNLVGIGDIPAKIQKLFENLRGIIDRTIENFFKKYGPFLQKMQQKAKQLKENKMLDLLQTKRSGQSIQQKANTKNNRSLDKVRLAIQNSPDTQQSIRRPTNRSSAATQMTNSVQLTSNKLNTNFRSGQVIPRETVISPSNQPLLIRRLAY